MERRYGCNVEPYLSEGDGNVYDRDIEDQFKLQKNNIPINSEDGAPNDPDYTIAKFTFYDDFVKKLQVMNIIYTACMMCKELFKVGLLRMLQGFTCLFEPV